MGKTAFYYTFDYSKNNKDVAGLESGVDFGTSRGWMKIRRVCVMDSVIC